jgi:hypothetical protein
MIKIQYEDGLGLVEATFDNFEEYSKFREEVAAKRQTAMNEKMAKEQEEVKAREKEAQEQAAMIACRWNDLKSDAERLVAKAKSYGVTPSGFVDLIRSTMSGAADDRCEPGKVELSEAPLRRQAVDLNDLIGDKDNASQEENK